MARVWGLWRETPKPERSVRGPGQPPEKAEHAARGVCPWSQFPSEVPGAVVLFFKVQNVLESLLLETKSIYTAGRLLPL